MQPEYVYLLRAVVASPNAKMPTVELPVAVPPKEFAEDDVAEAFTQPEYVYLLRVVLAPQPLQPKANIPKQAFPVAAPWEVAFVEAVADALTSPE